MDLKVDENNDLVIENNELILIDGPDFVRQMLIQRLQSFLGEWFLDIEVGVPYFQDILKKDVSISKISNIFKDEILNTPGVVELQQFDLSFNELTRRLSLTFAVKALNESIVINLEELI